MQMSQSISQSGQSAVQMSQNISPSVQALTHTAPLSDSWANVYQFLRTEDFAREFFIGGIAFTAAILLVIFLWFFVKLEQPTGNNQNYNEKGNLRGLVVRAGISDGIGVIFRTADALCSAAYECPVRVAGRLLCGDAVIF